MVLRHESLIFQIAINPYSTKSILFFKLVHTQQRFKQNSPLAPAFGTWSATPDAACFSPAFFKFSK
jgi:hypothetical protein